MLCLDFQHSTYFISTYFIYFEIQDRRKFLLNFSVNLIHTETTKPLTFKYQDLFDWGWSVCFWYFTSHLFGFVQANFIFRDLNRFFFFYKIHSTRNLHFYNSYKEINNINKMFWIEIYLTKLKIISTSQKVNFQIIFHNYHFWIKYKKGRLPPGTMAWRP